MKQTNQVVETLLSSTHVQLDKHLCVKKLLVSSLIALGGIVAIVLMMAMDESDTTLSMALLTIGIILLLFALNRFFTKSHETIYKPTGSVVRSGSLYMDSLELQNLQQMIKKNHFPETSRVAFKEGGNGRLDYMISKDGRFVAVQLFQFVPYTYESVSDILYYTDDEAVAIARCINI
jgi:hypothetical protein